MDVREKLVELIGQAQDCGCDVTNVVEMNYVENITLVDHLIAHGVTVQEDCRACAEATQNCIVKLQEQIAELRSVQKWISVKDQEEPTENGTYLCHGYWFGSRREQTETAEFFGEWNIANNFILTHWMPLPKLPQPPKGE